MPGFKSAVIFCASLLFTLLFHASVSAQSEAPKIEVGAQFSVLGSGRGYLFDDVTSIGGGGRVTFNLTRYLALEGELNYFPSAGFDNVRRFQGQFGVKSGLRFDRLGVFGKVRPGFINTKYDFRPVCIQVTCLPTGVCTQIFPPVCSPITTGDTGFSLDVGGVLEFYPSKRLNVRFDIGDTIVNRQEAVIAIPLNSAFFGVPGRNFATHNLQLGAGVGVRF